VIRQAISCDICASEKKQTNHWFVAYEQAGELRVGGWNSRNRLRPGSKHLCGQTCLHKLVDDFIAKVIEMRLPHTVADVVEVGEMAVGTDTSLTSNTAYVEVESSARLLPSPLPALPKLPPFKPQPELVAMPVRSKSEELAHLPSEPPRFTSRSWRAEAWEREREREQSAGERRPDSAARRRSSA
jgi:hypothetical protein